MLKTKSIYDPKEYGDGTRILISRFYPRGIKKEHFQNWQKDLSPSPILIRKYKNNEITWSQFFSEFQLELRENQKSIEIINQLYRKSRNSNITLLCFEPNGAPCHRHLLREIIQNPKLLKKDFVPKFLD